MNFTFCCSAPGANSERQRVEPRGTSNAVARRIFYRVLWNTLWNGVCQRTECFPTLLLYPPEGSTGSGTGGQVNPPEPHLPREPCSAPPSEVVQLTVVPSGWVIVVVVVGIFGDGGAMDGVEGSEGGQRKFCCFYLSEMNFDRASGKVL